MLGKAWFVIFFSKLALMKYLAVWCLSVSKNLFFQIVCLHTYSVCVKVCVKRISVCYYANCSRLETVSIPSLNCYLIQPLIMALL